MKKTITSIFPKTKFALVLLFGFTLLFTKASTAQVVILQQGFDSTAGSHDDGTWTVVSQIQNGGNAWSSYAQHSNDVIEGNYSCSGWSSCYDKTGGAYGITGGAPNFKGTGTNVGYSSTTNSTYFAIFDDYDAPYNSYGEIFTPTFNLSGYNTIGLTFYWNNANTYESNIQVQYKVGTSWIWNDTNYAIGTGSLGWHKATMALPSNATQVVLIVTSDYEYYPIALDQIEIYGTPNCTLSASVGSPTSVSPCSTSTNGAATVTVSGGTTPYSYSWTPSTGLSGATTASASNMSEGSYSCTVTDHNGCVQTPTVSIGGPSAVTGSITAQSNVTCYGGSNGSATVAGSDGTSPYVYSWTSGKGTNSSASGLTAGYYTVTISDAHSCTGSVVVDITQGAQIRDSISSSTNEYCNAGTNGSATVGVKGGTSPYVYSWAPSGGTHATASSLAAGTYTCTVTDHNGCTNTTTATITQPSAVTPIISIQGALCNGEKGGASVTTTGGTPSYSYSWSTGSTKTSISAYAGSYTVTATDYNGCTGTAVGIITQPTVFEGEINTYNICGSGTGQIGVDLTGGTPPYGYSWHPNITTTDTAYGLASGSSYTITVNDANGCELEGNTTIETITAETVSVTSYSISCNGGNNGSATAVGSPTPTYQWEPGGSTSASISSLSAGIYTVVATETDECTATATVNITQPSVITPTTSYTNTCSGTSNGAVSVSVTGGVSPYSYSWSPGGNTTTSVTNLAAGVYTVTITDHNSCVKTATATISSNSLPTLTVSPTSASICIGSSTSLSVSGASTYTWTPNINISATTGSSVSANPTITKIYTVTGTNSNGCVNTQTVSVNVNPLPTLTVTPDSASICAGSSTSLSVSGASTYTWAPNINISATTGATVTANPTVTTTYTVMGTNSNGCVSSHAVIVTVNSLPVVSVTAKHDTICAGILDSLKATGASLYTWSPITGLSATTGSAVAVINLNTTTTYTVTGMNNDRCIITASQVIVVNISPKVNADSALVDFMSGGAGTVSASGGTPPYTYTWSPNPPNPFSLPTSDAVFVLTTTDAIGCSSRDTANFTPTADSAGPCGALFISEYIQDTVNHDDGIEIYNPTSNSINLSNYYIGGTTGGAPFNPPFMIKLSGTVAPHKTFLLANIHADTALKNKANQLSDTLVFGGQDLVALAYIAPTGSSTQFTLLDKIGDFAILYTDSGWTAGTGSTKNHTLVRQASVQQGDLNWTTCQNEWASYPRGIFSYIGHYSNVCNPGDPVLELSIANFYTNCYGPTDSVSFIIDATSTPDTHFNSCVIDFQYSTAEFGGDDVGNGGVHVTPGPDFGSIVGDNDYSTFSYKSLPGDTAVEITFGDSTSSASKGTTISSTPGNEKSLFIVTLRIQNNCQVGTISCNNTTNQNFYTDSIKSTYTLTCDSIDPDTTYTQCDCATCFDSQGNFDSLCCSICTTVKYTGYTCDTAWSYTYFAKQYNSTTYPDPSAAETCTSFVVSNFTSSVFAGVGDTLTISGYGFGNSRGSGQVEFQTADSSAGKYLPSMNAFDYLSWNNSQIKIRLPSFVDSVSSNLSTQFSIGGGNFKVKNSCGLTQSSSTYIATPFAVPYNLQQHWNSVTGKKDTIFLRSADTNGGYVLRLNPNDFPRGSIRRLIFSRAMRDWRCYTGVNWSIGADTVINYVNAPTQVNYVFLTAPGSNVVAQTDNYVQDCPALGQAVLYEGDMYFDSTRTYVYDTTETVNIPAGQFDFYGVCLHELGHLILLDHNSNPRYLMYWAGFRGFIADTSRINLARYSGATAVDGGIVSVQRSAKPVSYNCMSLTPMQVQRTSCLNPDNVEEVVGNSNFAVYPNPSTGTFTIVTSLSDYRINVFNILGQNIYTKKIQSTNAEIDISTQPNGMYFIQLQNTEGVFTKKIIIQK